jgi:hypothetical protein
MKIGFLNDVTDCFKQMLEEIIRSSTDVNYSVELTYYLMSEEDINMGICIKSAKPTTLGQFGGPNFLEVEYEVDTKTKYFEYSARLIESLASFWSPCLYKKIDGIEGDVEFRFESFEKFKKEDKFVTGKAKFVVYIPLDTEDNEVE